MPDGREPSEQGQESENAVKRTHGESYR
jgi:hypothetical protein